PGGSGPELVSRDGVEAGAAQRGFASGAEPASTPSAPSSISPSSLPPRGNEDLIDGSPELAVEAPEPDESATGAWVPPPLAGRPRQGGRRLVRPKESTKPPLPEQRLLLLDTWQRSKLPVGDFATLVGVSKFSLLTWKRKFDAEGPAGLLDRPKGARRGSQLPDLTKRTSLMLKQANPEGGCQRISDMLWRGPALPASAAAVAKVLHEAGYQMEEMPTRPHPDTVHTFERAKPNQLWQTDLFTFVLKRQNRRVYLVA